MKRIVCTFLVSMSLFALNAKTVRVGYFKDGGKVMNYISDTERKSGFSYEYLQTVASYTDWEFEYVYGYWDELYEKLISGELDVLTDVSYSEARTKLFDYSEYPMAQENYFLYVNRHNKDVMAEDISSLNGKSIALAKGTYQYELLMEWLKHHDVKLNISIVPFDKVSECAFNRGDYDLFLAIDLISSFDWEPVVKIGCSDIFIAVSKKRPDLLKELNEAQTTLYLSNPYYNNNLWGKYFSTTSITKRLSAKETEWLCGKTVLNIGCFKNDFLYSPDNYKDNSGVVNYIMLLLKKQFNLNNLEFKYYFYEDKPQITQALKSGEIDLAFPFIYDLYSAEENKITLSLPFVPASFCYVFVQGMSYEKIVKKVGLLKGKRATEFYEESSISKNSEITYFDTMDQCLNAILMGQINSAVVNTSAAASFIFGREKYRMLTMTDLDSVASLCFAADNQNRVVISLINKLISVMNKNDLNAELVKYSVADKTYSFYDFIDDYLVFIITGFLLLVILVIALVAALKYIKVLMNYDSVTNLRSRHTLNNYIQRFIDQAEERDESFSIIIFDLDEFKYINEKFGHATGDEVLKHTSEIILRTVTAKDKVFRWGGAEFLVLIQADKKESEEVADKIRQNIMDEVYRQNDKKFSVTVTGGMSVYEDGKDYTQMLLEAEENLYTGKMNGKNRIIS